MSEEGHSLVLAFDTDEPDFAYGFEAGALWRELELKPDDEITQTVHGCNAEMFMRMAEKLGREFSGVPLDDEVEWMDVTFGPSNQEPVDD